MFNKMLKEKRKENIDLQNQYDKGSLNMDSVAGKIQDLKQHMNELRSQSSNITDMS